MKRSAAATRSDPKTAATELHALPHVGSPTASTPVVSVMTLSGFNEQHEPLVSGLGVARSIVSLGPADIGAALVLAFEEGDRHKPIIMGLLHAPASPVARARDMQVQVDGKRITFSAEEEITLRCGDACITLTRAGKILLRGAYLSSRASGVNRIQGGSVQIN